MSRPRLGPTPPRFWSRGRTAQWMAGRGLHQDGSRGFWFSSSPRHEAELCDRFRQEHGPDAACGISVAVRWAVARDFITRAGIDAAVVLDPLGGVRRLHAWEPASRRECRAVMAAYPGCASARFDGGVWVGGAGLADALRVQLVHWMRAGAGDRDHSVIFPSVRAHLCLCHHDGLHLLADRVEVAAAFRAACEAVVGKSVAVVRVEW